MPHNRKSRGLDVRTDAIIFLFFSHPKTFVNIQRACVYFSVLSNGSDVTVASSDVIEVSEFGDLSFLEAQKTDSGRYTCTAVNSLGQESASAYLNVISKFKICDMDYMFL